MNYAIYDFQKIFYLLSMLLLLLAITIDDNVEDEEAGRLLGDVLSIVLAEQPIFFDL